MHYDAMQAVMRAAIQPAANKLVALVLATHANKETGHAWPSLGTLAAECSLSRSQIKRVLSHLLEIGALMVVKASAGGAQKATTVYAFDLDCLGHLTGEAVQARTRLKREPGSSMNPHPVHWRTGTRSTDEPGPGPSMNPKGEVKWNGTEPNKRGAHAPVAARGRSGAAPRVGFDAPGRYAIEEVGS